MMETTFRNKPTVRQAVVFAVAAAVAAGCATEEFEQVCDRACLVDVAERYLAAVAAGDPELAPLSENVAFVENITPIEFGEGIWASAAGAGGFRIFVPDPVAGAVGIMTVIDRRTPEGVVPAMLAVRLEVDGGEITEAEHLVADVPEADPANLAAARPALVTEVPDGERMRRDEIAAVAASYYDALVASDGSLAPFADDCERQENGVITAGPELPPAPFDSIDVEGRSPPAVARDCAGQLSSRRFAYIDSIDDRRVFAVDPVLGLAMGFSHFRQSMARGPHLLIAADGSEVMWDEKREPYDLPAAHVWKITNGEIHEVEALGIFMPYDSRTGSEALSAARDRRVRAR